MNNQEIIKNCLEENKDKLNEEEKFILSHMADGRTMTDIAKMLGKNRKVLYQTVARMKYRGIGLPSLAKNQHDSKLKEVPVKHEQPKIVFNEIAQKNSTYSIIKITTTDKALVESIIRGEL